MSVRALRTRRSWRTSAVQSFPTSSKRSTKDILIDTGERLFGQHGFHGISLREIAEVAGQGNCNAVQYHFKDKRGFISAILNDRVTRLDALRRQRLDELKKNSAGKHDPRELLKIIWLPDMSITGPDGSHTYCRFSIQWLLQPNAADHPYYKFDPRSRKSTASREGEKSCLFALNELLRKHYPKIGRETFNKRLSSLSVMFLCSVVEHDNARGPEKMPTAYNIEPVLDMSIGALSAPIA